MSAAAIFLRVVKVSLIVLLHICNITGYSQRQFNIKLVASLKISDGLKQKYEHKQSFKVSCFSNIFLFSLITDY